MNPIVIGLICVGLAVAAQAIELTVGERIVGFFILAFLSHAYIPLLCACVISLIIQAGWAFITRPSKPPEFHRPATDWLDLR